MAEFTNIGIASVAAGQNVPLTETAVSGNCSIVHREGAGVVTLRGLTNQCNAQFKVSFGANIAIPDGGTVEAITAALSVDGEALASTVMTVTPAATENYSNVFTAATIVVPRGCCVAVAATNTSTQTINFANSKIIVERKA